MTQNNFNSENLFVIVWKSKKALMIVGILAVIASAIVSLMMEEKFLSTATVFPAKTNSVNLSGTNLNPTQTLTTFGDTESAEQMLQILNSSEIKTNIINEFDLFKHYRIKDNDKYRYTTMNKKYENNINFNRTKLGSVQVSVYDRSPDTAAQIANRIVTLYDEVKNLMIRERSTIIFK
jgi:capsular polysaccharide biosynthesis protein